MVGGADKVSITFYKYNVVGLSRYKLFAISLAVVDASLVHIYQYTGVQLYFYKLLNCSKCKTVKFTVGLPVPFR